MYVGCQQRFNKDSDQDKHNYSELIWPWTLVRLRIKIHSFCLIFLVDWTERIRLWHCQRKHSDEWSWNRRCFWWWETYGRWKGIWIWCLETVYEEIHYYHQPLQRFASCTRHQIWISWIKKIRIKILLTGLILVQENCWVSAWKRILVKILVSST